MAGNHQGTTDGAAVSQSRLPPSNSSDGVAVLDLLGPGMTGVG